LFPPPPTSEAGILSAKVVSCSNINGYLRNYQDCLTLASLVHGFWREMFSMALFRLFQVFTFP
jgi:hypothetical protein